MFHQDNLKGHVYEDLPASRQLFQCQDCGKQYNTQLGYKRHLVAFHSTTSGQQCMKESAAMLENLAEHSDTPLSTEESPNVPLRERKYSCERCDRRFYTRKDVRRHAVVHTGRRDFLCPCCAQRFGRRDHLTRHLKKSHAQESGLMPPSTPSTHVAPQTSTNPCPVKEEPSPESSTISSATKDTSEAFTREMSTSYTLTNLIPAMGHPHGLVQGSLSSSMGVGHHLTTHSSHSLRHGLQPPAASQQQPYGNMSQYQYGPSSYPRSDMESFLLDFQSNPSPQLSTMNSSISASPQKQILGDGPDVGGDTHALPRTPAISNDLPCNTNVDLGSLLSFLPFSLPPYNPHMGLVMGYPPSSSPTSSPSSSSGFSSQAPGPFTFFQPPQSHAPQGSGVFNHSQLPQSYSPAVSNSSSLPHYYHAFQQ
ncbi:zinc finger protein PLAG1-like [Poecilia reticulata]|uniref:Zinc finger protein PLAG1-like n=1 Tax=Poecilia reticulata TaxID=8081 RepID=A0A3P9NST0_POERE|nr:PREDICTED: zinc finger protein PLAG1-like [Poecilia reticulata]XP_008411187.1 PREDICTED: zinc finger protein PLAG1-like [Poecilia reticulata]